MIIKAKSFYFTHFSRR